MVRRGDGATASGPYGANLRVGLRKKTLMVLIAAFVS